MMAYPDYEAIKRRHTGNGHDQSWHKIKLIDFADMHARLDARPLIRGVLEHEQVSLIIGNTGSGKPSLLSTATSISRSEGNGLETRSRRVGSCTWPPKPARAFPTGL